MIPARVLGIPEDKKVVHVPLLLQKIRALPVGRFATIHAPSTQLFQWAYQASVNIISLTPKLLVNVQRKVHVKQIFERDTDHALPLRRVAVCRELTVQIPTTDYYSGRSTSL